MGSISSFWIIDNWRFPERNGWVSPAWTSCPQTAWTGRPGVRASITSCETLWHSGESIKAVSHSGPLYSPNNRNVKVHSLSEHQRRCSTLSQLIDCSVRRWCPTWPSRPERCPLAGPAQLWHRCKTDFRNLPLALTVSMYLNLSCHSSYL